MTRLAFILGLVALLLAGAATAFAADRNLTPSPLLALAPLSDAELAAVAGKGAPGGPGSEVARVILWDEEPAKGGIKAIHSSTGLGGTQFSTVTVKGR